MQNTTVEEFTKDFKNIICNLTENKTFSSLIFLCVGTDRITGDCFGPIVGNNLKKYFSNTKNVVVLGDLESTICSNNIDKVANEICEKYSNPFIISIDSAMSFDSENVGKIVVEKGGIVLGSCLGKEKYIIGDMNIKGIIAKKNNNARQNFAVLQNVSLGLVCKMADIVASGIFNSIDT